MRQGAAAVRPRQPACGGSSTAFRPKRASSLGCHGRTAAARGRMTAGKWVSAGQRRSEHMATIGTVTKHDDGHYEGELKTLSIRADITIMPISDKVSHAQPDFRVLSKGVEIGAGWLRIGQMSGKEYVSLSISAPELGSKTLYANLGRAAGETDQNVYALIWNPREQAQGFPPPRRQRRGGSWRLPPPSPARPPPGLRAARTPAGTHGEGGARARRVGCAEGPAHPPPSRVPLCGHALPPGSGSHTEVL